MDDIRKMQLMLTDMLKVFHDFCQEYSLRYYAIGGTALGAARHHGFIPWDDDIDVGMPRPDYERFIELYNNKKTDDNYILETPYSTDKFYSYSYLKLYDSRTTLIENTRHPIKRGIFIDIFPLDGAGNERKSGIDIIKNKKKYGYIRGIKTKTTTDCSTERHNKSIMLLAANKLLDLFFSVRFLRLKIDLICRRYNFDESLYVANFMGWAGQNEIMRKEVFGIPRQVAFENIFICCPDEIDKYLTTLYNDWRKLPPKEKRVTHHNYYLDLNKPYIEN